MTDKDFDKPQTPTEVIDEHRDPITGAPHSHPTATGVGAVAAGVIATAAGALAAGPLGAIAGAIVGSGAGGLVGHTVGENNERKELAEAGAAPNINTRLAEEDAIRNTHDTTHLEPGVPSRTGDPINGPLAAPLPSSTRDVPNSGDFTRPQTLQTDTLGAAGTRTSVDPTGQYNDPALRNQTHNTAAHNTALKDTFSDPNTRDANLLDDDSDDIVGVVVVEETTIIARDPSRSDRGFGDDFSDPLPHNPKPSDGNKSDFDKSDFDNNKDGFKDGKDRI